MRIDIRPVPPERLEDFIRTFAAAFGEEFRRDELEDERSIFDAAQTFGAFEGREIVGGASATTFELTVPGAITATAGVTNVAVLPTHRRRGILRSLMRRQLDELHERGLATAYLWASEAAIYQRFGYGLATLAGTFEIERHQAALAPPLEAVGRRRLLERADALKVFPSVYDRVRAARPGMVGRDDVWWNVRFRDTERDRDGASPYFYVAHEGPEGVDGYVVYRIKEDWSLGTGPHHTLEVEELIAATHEAYASLWRYCFEVDLVGRIKGWKRPADEPLLLMLQEPRALRWTLRDGTWLRLVDVPGALESRRYAAHARVVLEVTDAFCDWNAGRFELDGGPEGATCRPTTAGPDLRLDVADLGAAFLGGISFRTLAAAGRVKEAASGAAQRSDAMFASGAAPWCPHVF